MRQLKISKQVTNRESISLEKYLSDISRIGMISSEEEIELTQKIKQGDEQALEKLTKANLRFVVSVAKQYQNQGLTLSDLINEGNIGLIKAAQRFDETRGFKFISYAVWWIRQSIMQAIAEHARIVRLPLNKISGISKVNKTFSKLEQQFEREPSFEELADSLEITLSDVTESFRISGRHSSMDAPLSSDEDSNSMLDVYMDDEIVYSPDTDILKESLQNEIERSLSTLSYREAEIIRLFYGINYKAPISLEEIGERFELTRERVRQLRDKGIKKLKHTSKSKLLKPYLS
ncbi:MAG: RNA polymerase sigma factor RpoD/SigA [Flavobacteriales bacterium]|nr:RNA polymerase sigma factor RpoD/SigA [Flavobacteriales bacterium]